jgi:uncharacterized protein (TIGR02145 family)
MNKTRSFLLATAVAAMVFTFSCSSGDDDGNSCTNFRTVAIGSQTWMAENFNCNVSGSKCYGNNPANCAKYGRLYYWTTAMDIPSKCDTSICSNLIQPKHRGICPPNWHIPSSDDWGILMDYVGGSSTAGRYLKATNGWAENGNGTDEHDFSALPSGTYSDGRFNSGLGFYGLGDYGGWWIAGDSYFFDEYSAEFRNHGGPYCDMDYSYSNVYRGYSFDFRMYSVRCVKD